MGQGIWEKNPLRSFWINSVQKILSNIEAGRIEGAISVVTEIYYRYLEEKIPDLAKTRLKSFLLLLYILKELL